MMDLKNKIVLITGASSGIGKALAFEFAKKGSRLILASKSIDKLKNVSGQIEEMFPGLLPPMSIECDVCKVTEIKSLFSYCEKHTQGIDILINNAGIGVYGECEKVPMEDYRNIMEINFFGALKCMLEAIPLMKKRKSGIIVNIASLAAIHGVPYLAAYGASKAALENASQSLQSEVAKDGIKIMMVYPGYTKTELFEKEKIYGNAHRPKTAYAPVEKVAGKIVRSIERGDKKLIFTLQGKMLALVDRTIPVLVRKKMEKIASELKS